MFSLLTSVYIRAVCFSHLERFEISTCRAWPCAGFVICTKCMEATVVSVSMLPASLVIYDMLEFF